MTTASGQHGGATGCTGEGQQHAEELKTDRQDFKGLRAHRCPVPTPEVLEPEALRREIAAEARKIADRG